jgi:tRNA threonylcarbamoyl adenosine modification protein YeaZ
MTAENNNLVLAIEAAVSGGSISLINNGTEVANWIGTSGTAKAENLLANIDRLLDENKMSIRDVSMVAVSAGPGSFTGIRIGISTALGLTTGLDIELASESALKAMACQFPGHQNVTAAVPAGRDTVCFQTFDTASGVPIESSVPETEREADFITRASAAQNTHYVLHSDIFEKLSKASTCADFGRNIAFALAMVCEVGKPPRTKPLFISKSF